MQQKPALTRRHFLAGAVAVAAAPFVLPPSAPGRLGRALAPVRRADLSMLGATGPLSIGYVAGSDDLDDLALAPWAQGLRRVVPAASLRSGDPSLDDAPVQVNVKGPGPGGLPADQTVTVDTLISGRGRGAFPFYAWTYRPGTSGTVNGARFTATPAPDMGLGFAVGSGSGPSSTRLGAALTPGREQGWPKLRRGAYLLGLQPGAWASAVQVGEGGEGAPPSVLVTIDGERA